MPNLVQRPTVKRIKAARRLMASAQLESIRLLQADAEYSPLKGTVVSAAGKAHPGLYVSARFFPEARLEAKEKMLRVSVRYLLHARRGPARQSQLALRIRVLFELRYALPEGLRPTSEEATAFSHTNAMLNSWPYWREFVQNTVARMNLPPLTLPLFRLVPPRPSQSKPTPQRG
jgi:hypothetical protein